MHTALRIPVAHGGGGALSVRHRMESCVAHGGTNFVAIMPHGAALRVLPRVCPTSPPVAGNLQGEELPVRGVDATGLDAVLRFFYSGEWPPSTRRPAAIADLLAAALLVPVLSPSLESAASPGEIAP